MSCPTKDLCIVQGDEKVYNLTFTSGGVVQDLTGATVTMSIKKNFSDDEALVTKTVTSHTDADNGETSITLSANDTDLPTGDYYYDIQISGGSISKTTILKGKLEITWQVSE